MKEKIKKLKEFAQDSKGKAILFFGFYFFFFIILIVITRFANTFHRTNPTDYEKGRSYSIEVDALLQNNYHFSYTISQDDVKYEYVGDKCSSDQEMFSFLEDSYYHKGDAFYQESRSWSECDNPYLYSEFLDISNVLSLFDLATYESKTNYESGKVNYNFLISSNTINQQLYQIDSDFFEEPNVMVISLGEDQMIQQIYLQLDSFCTMNQLCQRSLRITLQFDHFGDISKIDSPL